MSDDIPISMSEESQPVTGLEPSVSPEQPLRVVSERKREANRRNAQRSTGPRTREGKRVSRFNAYKHGLLAQVAVVEWFEDGAAFRRFYEQLRAECEPVGMREEILVEKAALAYWGMRRAAGYEASQIYDEHELLGRGVPYSGSTTGEVRRMIFEGTSEGVAELAAIIGRVRAEVNQHGVLSDETIEELIENFGGEYATVAQCVRVNKLVRGAAPQGAKEVALANPETGRTALLTLLAEEGERLETRWEELSKEEEREWKAAIAEIRRRPILLDADTLNKVLRYEGQHERTYYRALQELERLQERRSAGRDPMTGPAQRPSGTKQSHRGSSSDEERPGGSAAS